MDEYDRLQRQAMYECSVLAIQKDPFIHSQEDHFTQTKATKKKGIEKINDYLYQIKRIQTPSMIVNGQRNESIDFHRRVNQRELRSRFKMNQHMGRAKSACGNDRQVSVNKNVIPISPRRHLNASRSNKLSTRFTQKKMLHLNSYKQNQQTDKNGDI